MSLLHKLQRLHRCQKVAQILAACRQSPWEEGKDSLGSQGPPVQQSHQWLTRCMAQTRIASRPLPIASQDDNGDASTVQHNRTCKGANERNRASPPKAVGQTCPMLMWCGSHKPAQLPQLVQRRVAARPWPPSVLHDVPSILLATARAVAYAKTKWLTRCIAQTRIASRPLPIASQDGNADSCFVIGMLLVAFVPCASSLQLKQNNHV